MYRTKICNSPLNLYIRGIWEMEFRGYTRPKIQQALIPSGMPELLFCFGDILDSAGVSTSAFILGQRTKALDFSVGKCNGIISIIMQPWALGRFFTTSASQFSEKSIDASAIIPETDEILERLYFCSNFDERVDVLEKWLYRKLSAIDSPEISRFQYFSNAAESTQPQKPIIQTIAGNSNLSVRQVERIFKEEIGLPPKKFNSVLRFQKSIYIRQTKPELSLAALAFNSGYSDQAHMSHDYKKLSGISPLNFFNSCTPFSDYYSLR